jgi:hypothetical protein
MLGWANKVLRLAYVHQPDANHPDTSNPPVGRGTLARGTGGGLRFFWVQINRTLFFGRLPLDP